MPKQILEVGNCDMDHGNITAMINQNFDANIVRVHGEDDALSEISGGQFDLVLVNRIFDRDGASGLDLIRKLKSEANTETPVMLITNFAEHQEKAQSLGAEVGFGKSELNSPETIAKLKPHLS